MKNSGGADRKPTRWPLRCVVCLCSHHHINWKPSNPMLWADLVRQVIGPERAEWINRAANDRKNYSSSLSDWLKVEAALKQEFRQFR